MLAGFFRLLFKIPFFRKRYYAFYIKIFRPLHLFKDKTVISTYDDSLKIHLDIDEWIQQQIYFMGNFDKRGIAFIKKQLKPGDTFIDVGANIGCYTLVASKITGPTGRVIAFEAIGEVFSKLQKNILLNKMQNIIAENKAIYERAEILTFNVASQDNMGMSSIYRHDNESGKIEEVMAVSIDEYVLQNILNRIDLIKIDIEGAEIHAIKGMTDTLKKYRPVVLMEISNDVLPNTTFASGDIFQLMGGLGYTPHSIDLEGNIMDLNIRSSNEYHNYVFLPE